MSKSFSTVCSMVHKFACRENRPLLCMSPVQVNSRRMAGHSKWANIRHTKAATDSKKSLMALKINRDIKQAIKEGGSLDPKLNSALARVIDVAKEANVPKATIERAIKQMEKRKGGSVIFIEARGPGNSMMVIEAYTDRVAQTRQLIASVVNRVGGGVLDKGYAQHAFDYKGIVNVNLPADTPIDQDKATEVAIEAEAEDVQFKVDEHGDKLLEFICDTKDVKIVKENLIGMGYEATGTLAYVPHMFVTLNEQEQKLASAMFDRFDDIEAIEKIYDNMQVPEDN